jgi:hypothetical protein
MGCGHSGKCWLSAIKAFLSRRITSEEGLHDQSEHSFNRFLVQIPDCVHLFDHRLKTKGRDLNFNNIDVDTLAQVN